MKNLLKLSLVAAFVALGLTSTQAQVDKIELALEDGNLKRALKLCETLSEDPAYKKNPEVYFLQAETYYRIINDKFLSTKYPDGLKLGIKSLEKGKHRADGEFFPEYLPLVDSFVMLNNAKAAKEYKINKYTGAIKTYQKSHDLNGDMNAIYWIGKCYLYMEDTATGEDFYNRVILWSGNQNAEGKEVDKLISDAYVHFADKYWVKDKYDSANLYLESARKIFGTDPKIDYFQKEVTKEQIKQIPPSSLMMEKIKKTLSFFPTDTFFVKKENALYLYLMRNHLANGDSAKLDTMLAHFCREKVERSNSKRVNRYKKSDQFLDTKRENVLWKLVKYFGKFGHEDMSNYTGYQYIAATASSMEDEDMLSRYSVIIDYAAKSQSLALATQLLQDAEKRYGETESTMGLRNSLISKNQNEDLSTKDQSALYTLLMKSSLYQGEMAEETDKLVAKYIDALIKDKDYAQARKVVFTHIQTQPDNPQWSNKLDELTKEDFYYSYYQTRVVDEVVAGTKVNGYEWNGSSANCRPGEVDDAIQKKVEDRINYFRRQAGVPEIYLDPELNDWCQKAALMMESNKNLSHEPDSRWRCYTDEGAHAARYSLLTKGATTTRAVTSFMADTKNPSVGNRRWLLYPNGLALGHGSTENATVIWALDDSGSVDTNIYSNRFVAWPPEGSLPKMMVFNHWSFSLKQDLTDAVVTMTAGEDSIPVQVFDLVDGYGLPTLVWQPQTDIKSLPHNTEVLVGIELKNGRKYTYTVKIIDFDPVGY
ncbi:MAG: CAP domain-containing protein [Bacteroidia bacterium]|nr:CAP domain-containing protein [Bacteroidia bacterium]